MLRLSDIMEQDYLTDPQAEIHIRKGLSAHKLLLAEMEERDMSGNVAWYIRRRPLLNAHITPQYVILRNLM